MAEEGGRHTSSNRKPQRIPSEFSSQIYVHISYIGLIKRKQFNDAKAAATSIRSGKDTKECQVKASAEKMAITFLQNVRYAFSSTMWQLFEPQLDGGQANGKIVSA